MRSDIDKSKRLFMVQDRQWFKNFTNFEVDQYVKMRIIPQLDDIVSEWMNDKEFMKGVYDKETADIMNDKSWLETLSLYALAKNIQNLCSFNLSDMYESKMNKSKKLRINESRRFSSPTDAAEYFYNDYANYGGEEIKRFFKKYSYSYDEDFISDTYSILSDMYDDEMRYDSEHDYDWDD